MNETLPLFPILASAHGGQIDAVFLALVGITVFFTVLVLAMVVGFAAKYRRRPGQTIQVPHSDHSNWTQIVEFTWTAIPLVIVLAVFFWSTHIFLGMFEEAPSDSIPIFVTGKQWMWKFEHPDGRREINELHIPIGQSVKLLMVSQDVIHNVGIPAMRIKYDVVPMRYTAQWFTAVKPGKYHMYCDQYCGTNHSEMVGWVYAMRPVEYQAWLGNVSSDSTQPAGSPAETGRAVMDKMGCFTCHKPKGEAGALGPTLEGLYMSKVTLQGGKTVVADENYLRNSIMNSTAQIVNGFPPIMPNFTGQIAENELNQIVTYIKSLGSAQ